MGNFEKQKVELQHMLHVIIIENDNNLNVNSTDLTDKNKTICFAFGSSEDFMFKKRPNIVGSKVKLHPGC